MAYLAALFIVLAYSFGVWLFKRALPLSVSGLGLYFLYKGLSGSNQTLEGAILLCLGLLLYLVLVFFERIRLQYGITKRGRGLTASQEKR